MDRRTFLHVLATVGVLTGAPSWLRDPRMLERFGIVNPPLDDDVSEWLEPTDLAVYGRDKTFDLIAANESNETGYVYLARPGADYQRQTLLSFTMPPGGFLRWSAEMGEEIYGPVRIVAPEFFKVSVYGTDSRGRIVCADKNGLIPLSLA
jgi:hypothetical protein